MTGPRLISRTPDDRERTIEVPMRLPSPTHGNRWATKTQREVMRQALDVLLRTRTPLPCRVLLVRVGSPRLDDDRNVGACAGCRDEIARWLHGQPPYEMVTIRGQLVPRPPRAKDGPNDGIEWAYGSELGPPRKRLTLPTTGKVKLGAKYEAIRVTITATGTQAPATVGDLLMQQTMGGTP